MGNLISPEITQTLESKFIHFPENGKIGPIRVLKIERKPVNDPMYGDKDGMHYEIAFDTGQVMTTVSKRLLRRLGDVNSGDLIEITRTGTGFATDYSVHVLERALT